MFRKVRAKVNKMSRDRIMMFMQGLWLATVVSAFFGPLLALNTCPGIFAFKILFCLHLALFGFFLALRKIELTLNRETKPYFVFFLVWLAWALFSLSWADNVPDGLRNLWYLFSGLCLIGFTAFYIRQEKDLIAFFCILAAILLIIIGVGIWEYKTGLHLKTAGLVNGTVVISKTPRGVFKNQNDMATYLALYLPFLYISARYLAARLKTLLPALGLTACTGTGIFLIINTGSRGNLVAVALGLLAAVIIYLIRGKGKALKNVLVAATAATVLYFALASTHPALHYQLKRQFRIARHHLVSLEHAGGEHSARMILINNALLELNRHSLMGVGAGNAEEHMKEYRTETFQILALHNWWLEILVNYGIFIFVLYVAFTGKLLVQLFLLTIRAGPGVIRMVAESSLVGLVGFPIAAVSSSSLAYSRVMWIFFGMALCALNLHNCKTMHETEEGEKLESSVPVQPLPK
ncbi:MAG: Teichuronic acid biosynthesis protein TuaE [Firmicutes bacterium ADurb.Bin456]|nr:MAG: Teichuronic acid biosynthesis protein TuaE [Firmicutes bacterium ADurb.Bin456]